MDANITNARRREIYARDGYRCALCDCTQGIQIHHYVPRAIGGGNNPMNLITLCGACHAQAHGFICYDSQDITAETMEQAIVEYLADMYGPLWNPWERG